MDHQPGLGGAVVSYSQPGGCRLRRLTSWLRSMSAAGRTNVPIFGALRSPSLRVEVVLSSLRAEISLSWREIKLLDRRDTGLLIRFLAKSMLIFFSYWTVLNGALRGHDGYICIESVQSHGALIQFWLAPQLHWVLPRSLRRKDSPVYSFLPHLSCVDVISCCLCFSFSCPQTRGSGVGCPHRGAPATRRCHT